jgi:hypothetical protein
VRLRCVLIALIAFLAGLGPRHAAAHDPVAELDAHALAIATTFDPRVAATLPRLDGPGRRLLALRSYLRSESQIDERWSWTDAQMQAFTESPEHRALVAEIERVRQAFAQANPGHQLWVNPSARSLDVQVERWNENASVAAAADTLLEDALRHFTRRGGARPKRDASARREALAEFLRQYVPRPTPSLAAPGLSLHGQLRAVDFQVLADDGRVVAGPDVATIPDAWDAQGWAARLEQAVREAGCRFVGPLERPREPWHYTYESQVVAAREKRPGCALDEREGA